MDGISTHDDEEKKKETNILRLICTLRTLPVTGASWELMSFLAASTCICAIIWFEWKPNESRLKPGPRPWQSATVPPQVEVFAWQGCPCQGCPGDSQKAPSLEDGVQHVCRRREKVMYVLGLVSPTLLWANPATKVWAPGIALGSTDAVG